VLPSLHSSTSSTSVATSHGHTKSKLRNGEVVEVDVTVVPDVVDVLTLVALEVPVVETEVVVVVVVVRLQHITPPGRLPFTRSTPALAKFNI
jgi:hypothetical protein